MSFGFGFGLPRVPLRGRPLVAAIRAIFANGEQGVWYDPSDLSTLFQDPAGTTPVTDVEQPVGLMLDKSGNGNHASQTTATSRPVLKQDGNGKYYLYFDGVDDGLVTNTVSPGTDKVQVFAGVTRIGVTAASLVELNDLNTGNSLAVLAPSSGNTVQFGSHGPGERVYEIHSFTDNTAPSTSVWSGLFDRAGGAGSEITARRNGVVGGTNTRADNTTGNFLDYPLYIGRRAGTSLPFNGHLYSLLVRFGSNLPVATIERVERFINSKTGAY